MSRPAPKTFFMIQNRNNPYSMCPSCGQTPMGINNLPFLTCPAYHIFYKCPTCTDTRVSDKKENIYYCGLLHAYHICSVHKTPVIGVARMTSTCTCSKHPQQSIIRKEKIKNWDVPFL